MIFLDDRQELVCALFRQESPRTWTRRCDKLMAGQMPEDDTTDELYRSACVLADCIEHVSLNYECDLAVGLTVALFLHRHVYDDGPLKDH